jgi:hypothetical protein
MDGFFPKFALSDSTGYRLARHTVFWTACWLFQGVIYGFFYEASDHPYVSYVESLIFLPQHIFFSYSFIYYILPKFILKERYLAGVLASVALILITAGCSPLLNYTLIRPYREWVGFPIRDEFMVARSFMGGLRGSFSVGGFAVAIKLIKLWYFKKMENEQLEKEKLNAELHVLKGQLHPHFMFNTLNSIYALSLKNSKETPDAILKLSNLMRYIITECSQQTVELTKEIAILKHYIELEKSRFDHRLDLTININGDLEKKTIAPLLLLPFLENSFKHGASEIIGQAWISLDLNVTGDTLKFKLINGRNAIVGEHPNAVHVGLQNVKKRLSLLYPNAHNLRITEDADTFVVALTLTLDSIRPLVSS